MTSFDPKQPGLERSDLAPGGATADEPRVLRWYRAYCALMAGLYLVCGVIGFVLLFSDRPWIQTEDQVAGRGAGLLLAGLATPCCAGFAIGLLLPRRPWGWTYGLVLIAIGMTSVCCLPATIPLLVLWLRKDVKRFFGRADAAS